MKKTIAILSFLLTFFGASAQNVYWVFLADKAGTTFDPYSYFDSKALERYAETPSPPRRWAAAAG